MSKSDHGKPGTICKSCDNARKRAARAADPEGARARQRAYRLRNIERERARAREQARTPRGRELNRRAVARYRKAHPEVIAAQYEAQQALRRGELRVALVCEVLGCREADSLHLHHIDYAKPRDVVRACREHHEHLHHRGPLELKPGGRRKIARAPRHEPGAR